MQYVSGRNLIRVAISTVMLAFVVASYGFTEQGAHAAPASLIEINSLADITHVSPCAGVALDCTLRDAINVANGGSFNNIRFISSFSGATNFIFLSTPLPTIAKDGTWLDGSDKFGNPIDVFIDGQFVVGPMLKIGSADNVTISNLKFGNGDPNDTEIAVIGGRDTRIAYNRISSYYFSDGPCAFHVRNPGIGIRVESGVTGNGTPGQGSAYIYGNNIGCSGDGIKIKDGTFVYVGERSDGTADGNYIGLDSDSHPMSNTVGIRITGNSNRIRYNQIVRNNNLGVYLTTGAAFNWVGTNTISQQGNTGVQLDGGAHDNLIGSPLGGPITLGNLISANAREGIYISGASTRYNSVFGNLIGTKATGLVADGNGLRGVVLDNDANFNLIGSEATERNVISGNGDDGVQIINGAHDNDVSANLIGASATSSGEIPNGSSGVAIFAGAWNNTIGGSASTSGNLIRGNLGNGIFIAGSTTMSNTVSKSVIVSNRADGVTLQAGTHGNVIGGPFVPGGTAFLSNYIYAQGGSGVYVASGSHNNIISFTNIISNSLYGALFDGSNTADNVVQASQIVINGLDGIGERNNAGNNRWSQLSTAANGGLGIDKFASSDSTNVPNAPYATITSVSVSGGVVTVNGTGDATFNTGLAFSTVKVELYSIALDPTGFGEGAVYLGVATTDVSGNWQVTYSGSTVGCYTAFETLRGLVLVPFNYSTEFGPNSCRVFMPLIER